MLYVQTESVRPSRLHLLTGVVVVLGLFIAMMFAVKSFLH